MVAYNFHPMFEPQIVDLSKQQTVRANRKRHARPGEPVQLYAGMRQRGCRKLLKPDPICLSVQRISIATSGLINEVVASIAVDGIPLDRDEIEAFARADGFAPERIQSEGCATARENMGRFWLARHGVGHFEGVLIRWNPRP